MNIRAGFDGNLSDYLDENVIAHAFHHNAFLIVSNGDRARYGSITSELGALRRVEAAGREADKGSVEAEVLLERHAGAGPAARPRRELHPVRREQGRARRARWWRATTRCWASTSAVASVAQQEELKREFPPESGCASRDRTAAGTQRVAEPMATRQRAEPAACRVAAVHARGPVSSSSGRTPTSAGSACSGTRRAAASPIPWPFFAEKVRRKVPGNFTFLLMTDRNDLDSQIYKTFVGCGVADEDDAARELGRRT